LNVIDGFGTQTRQIVEQRLVQIGPIDGLADTVGCVSPESATRRSSIRIN